MNANFFREQAALCYRIARTLPQEGIADELRRIAADFEAKAVASPLRPEPERELAETTGIGPNEGADRR
jgi:hypothetical protein